MGVGFVSRSTGEWHEENYATAHPSSVRIGTFTYRVTSDPEEYNRYVRENDGDDPYGVTSNSHQVILLRPGMPLDLERSTLLHECMHALCEVMLGVPNWKKDLPKGRMDSEEKVIRMWEPALMQLMRDNYLLMAYLMGGVENPNAQPQLL